MGKIDSSYPTLLGGVSQVPFARRNYARHEEQVNMIPDPALGLVRRPGSVQRDLQSISGDAALTADDVADCSGFVGFDFQSEETDYTLLVRKIAKPGSSQITAAAVCVDRTNGALITVNEKPADTVLATLLAGGASSAAPLGALLVIAGNTITPTFTTEYPWAIEENQKRAVVWVRGGAYNRRYRMALVRGNQKLWIEYTTLEPSYPATLDTSDLDANDPDYLKLVNDRTNLYNTAATKWINDALLDITPENIADKLASGLRDSGFLSTGGTVEVIGSSVCITDPSIEDVEADDGGDGPLIRAVGNTVGAPELLSTLGYPGKVVQIRPGNSADGQVFYLRARAKDQSTGTFTQCTWEEAPGVLYTPTSAFVFATVEDGECYISSDIDWINTEAGTGFPGYQPSVAGDADSSAPPEFMSDIVTNVAVFQDRLIVSKSNGTVATSRPGDYLNFFRQSVLTVVDDDPVSFAIIGGESDTVRHSLMYDRNLVLIGGKKQYLISGKVKMAPGSASATVMSSIPGTTDSAPVLVEDRLFYTKGHNGYGSVHWFQPGQIAESPQTVEATSELTTYIPGVPTDIMAMLTPDMVAVRVPGTLGAAASLYLYHYGVMPNGKRLDTFHRWSFVSDLGPIMGMCHLGGAVYLVSLRRVGSTVRAVLDSLDLQTGANTAPYLDSQTASITLAPPLKALGAPTYVGGTYSALVGDEVGGWPMVSHITLTSPSVLTGAGEPVREGDTVVSNLTVHMEDTSGVVFQSNSGATTYGGYLHGKTAYVPPEYREIECPCEDDIPGSIEETVPVWSRKWSGGEANDAAGAQNGVGVDADELAQLTTTQNGSIGVAARIGMGDAAYALGAIPPVAVGTIRSATDSDASSNNGCMIYLPMAAGDVFHESTGTYGPWAPGTSRTYQIGQPDPLRGALWGEQYTITVEGVSPNLTTTVERIADLGPRPTAMPPTVLWHANFDIAASSLASYFGGYNAGGYVSSNGPGTSGNRVSGGYAVSNPTTATFGINTQLAAVGAVGITGNSEHLLNVLFPAAGASAFGANWSYYIFGDLLPNTAISFPLDTTALMSVSFTSPAPSQPFTQCVLLIQDGGVTVHTSITDLPTPITAATDHTVRVSIGDTEHSVYVDDVLVVTATYDMTASENWVGVSRVIMQSPNSASGDNEARLSSILIYAPFVETAAVPGDCQVVEAGFADDCEDAEPLDAIVVGGDTLTVEDPDNRIMSLTDAGTPTPPVPGAEVTDAAPYGAVRLHLPIGRRNYDYKATLASYYWGPLNITAIDWTGQYHNRTRRV